MELIPNSPKKKKENSSGHYQKARKGFDGYSFVPYELLPEDRLSAKSFAEQHGVSDIVCMALRFAVGIGTFRVAYNVDKDSWVASFTGNLPNTGYTGKILTAFGKSPESATACLVYVHSMVLREVWQGTLDRGENLFDF